MPQRPAPTEPSDAEHRYVLWDEDTCEPWHTALAAYPAAVTAYGGARLLEIDRWYHEVSLAEARARRGRWCRRKSYCA